jgi:hypothetical protein
MKQAYFVFLGFIFIAFLVSSPGAFASVWHVSTAGDDSTGNGSEEFPFRTIQNGIQVSGDGDTVLVEKGRYIERIRFLGKPILVASHFILDSLESTIDSTIIDGDSSGTVVSFVGGEDSNSVIQGFTITRGYSNDDGGGIYCGGTSPVIKNNIISNNGVVYHAGSVFSNLVPASGGGGIKAEWGGQPTIENNVIRGNKSYMAGGGVHLQYYVQPRFIGNIVEDNTAGGGGGLLLALCTGAQVRNNIFLRNSASFEGGNILIGSGENNVIKNNTIVGGFCSFSKAGGIQLSELSPSNIIANNIIVNSTQGYGIDADDLTGAYIAFNDVWNNASGNFHDLNPGIGDTTWGTNYNGTPCDSFHNIIRDPLFVDTSIGDYHLALGSPCIDAGNPSDSVPPGGGWRIDMGRFEYIYEGGPCGDANGDGVINVSDVVYLINYLFIGGPAPEPLKQGDANGDGVINASDIVYLINYLFVGGPPPAYGCPAAGDK